jgi:hypothetical protein
MRYRRIALIIAGLLAAVVLAAGVALGSDDSHHTNAKYLLWKHHLWPYSRDLALAYLNVDVDFRRSLNGKTRAELQKWFPVLTPIDPQDGYLPYCGEVVKTPGFVWIDGTRWGVVFEGDRVKDIVLFKG